MFAVTLLGGYVVTSVILFKYPYLLHRRKQLKFPCRHISHRGGSAENLENTLTAFRHAQKAGTDLLELDVQLTKDKKVVVSHDNTLLRSAGVNKLISDLAYKEIPPLKSCLPVDFWNGVPSAESKDCRMPLLSEVFAEFPNTPVNIDIKTPSEELIQEVYKLIKQFNREDITIWGSFHHSVTKRCYELNPKIPLFFSARSILYLLILTYTGLLPFFPIKETCLEIFLPHVAAKNPGMREQTKYLRGKILLRLFDWFIVRKFLIDHLRKRGIPTYLWVLNEKEDFQRAFDLGASGVMTDYPTLLAEFLKEHPNLKAGVNETDATAAEAERRKT